MKFASYGRNPHGRDFAVGAIHGCYSKLQDKLVAISFDSQRDRLFSVGDLVDRGEENELAEVWLRHPWFIAVKGNHDDMAERWPEGNMDASIYARNGGYWNMVRSMESQAETAAAMSALPLALEVMTASGLVGLVHAECPFRNWEEFRQQLLQFDNLPRVRRDALEGAAMWARTRAETGDQSMVSGVRAVVVGHTPLCSPMVLGNHYYIDTGAVFGREFTIVDLNTLQQVTA